MRWVLLFSLIVAMILTGIASCNIDGDEYVVIPTIMKSYDVTGSFTPEMIVFEELDI